MNLMKLVRKLQLICLLAVLLLLATNQFVNAQCIAVNNITATSVTSTSITFEWDTDNSAIDYTIKIEKNGVQDVNQTVSNSGATASFNYVSGVPFVAGDEFYVEIISNCAGSTIASWSKEYEFSTGGIATVEDIYDGSFPSDSEGDCLEAPYFIVNHNEAEGYYKAEVQDCWELSNNQLGNTGIGCDDDLSIDFEDILCCFRNIERIHLFKNTKVDICEKRRGEGRPLSALESRPRLAAEIINVQLSPNPLVEYGQIEFDLQRDTKVAIDITDISGSSLYQNVTEEALSAGRHQLEVNRNDLQPGIYLIRIRTNQSIETVKFSIAY